MRLFVVLASLVSSTVAFADDGSAELGPAVPKVAASKGLDTAPVRAVPWCAAVSARDPQWGFSVKAQLDNYKPNVGFVKPIFRAAALLCSAPTHPVAQRTAAALEQYWINATGLGEADAVASLTARVDADGFDAARDKLCDAIPERGSGDQQFFDIATRALFGCGGSEPSWINPRNVSELAPHVDRGAVEADPLLRLAWVLYRLREDLDPTKPVTETLPGYAIDQFDVRIPVDSVMHRLDAAPYRGSRYARIVIQESLARVRMLSARLEAAVAAKLSDAAWKELLVTAPQQGSAAWLAAVAKHKPAFARSEEFARKLAANESVEGCKQALRDDVAAMIKPMKHGSITELTDQISDDPLGGLLIEHLVQCMKKDGDSNAADVLAHVVGSVRIIRGPRMAASYATLDALAAMGKRAPFRAGAMTELDRADEHRTIDRWLGPEGVISALKVTKRGTKVTFVQNKQQVMQQECAEGTKIDHVDRDSGKVVYRRVCHDTGLKWVSLSPDPIVVISRFAAGLQVGRFIRFRKFEDTIGVPAEVYTDKSAKKLVAFYTFALN